MKLFNFEEYNTIVPQDFPQETITMSNLTSLVGIEFQRELTAKREIPNYQEVLRDTLKGAFTEIEIPTTFKIDELVDFVTVRFVQILKEKDPDLVRILNDLDKFETIPKSLKELRNFQKIFSDFNDKIKSYTAKALDVWSVYFYISDLPLSLFNEFSLLLETDRDFIEYISRLSKWFLRVRYRSLDREIERFSSKIGKISELALAAKKSYLKLFLFIQIQNARSYEDLFKIKPFSRKKLDSSHYRQLRLEFSKDLYEYRKKLESISPILFHKKIDSQTALLWSLIYSHA